MSQFIQDFRTKNPQYNDLSDEQLSSALHNKFYSDIPLEEFNQRIGLTQPVTTETELTEYDAISGATPPVTQELIEQPVQRTEFDAYSGAELPATPLEQALGETKTKEVNYLNNLKNQQSQAYEKPPEEKSMLELVEEKALSLVGAIGSGLREAIPQMKQQVGGFLSQYEVPSKEEYQRMMKQGSGILGATLGGDVSTYEKFAERYKAQNPIETFLADKGKELIESGKFGLPQNEYERGTPEYYAKAITGSIANMAPSLAISIAGRRPDIGLGVMLAQSKGGSYQQGRDEGLTPQQAQEYSSLNMAAEVIPSAFPIAKIMKPSGKFTRDLFEAGVTEGAQETITAALQAGIDKGYIKPNMTWGEFTDRVTDGAIVGFGSGVAISAGTSKVADKLNEREQSKQFDAEVEQAFDEALDVDTTQAAVDRLNPDNAQLRTEQKVENPELETVQDAKEKAQPEFEVDIKQQPIDKQTFEEQESVSFDLPVEEVEVKAKQPEESLTEEVKEDSSQDKDLANLQTNVAVAESEVSELQSKLDKVAERMKENPSWATTGRSNRSANIGRNIEALTNQEQKVFKELRQAEKNLSKAKSVLSGYQRGTLHADGRPKSQKETTQKANRQYSDYVKAKVKKGETIHNHALNTDEEVIRFNKNTVTVKSWNGTAKRDYLDLTPLVDGKPMSDTQRKQELKAFFDESQSVEKKEKIKPTQDLPPFKPTHTLKDGREVMLVDNQGSVKGFDEYGQPVSQGDIDRGIKSLEEQSQNQTDLDKVEKAQLSLAGKQGVIANQIRDAAQRIRIALIEGKDLNQAIEDSMKKDGLGTEEFVKILDVKYEPVKQQSSKKETEQDASKSLQEDPLTVAGYKTFMSKVAEQKATKEDILKSAENLLANKESIIAEMSERKFTKAMLQDIVRSPRTDLKKPQMVKQAYERMLLNHVMGDATFTVFGGSKSFEDQIIEKIRNQTQEDVNAEYDKQREYRARLEERKANFVKAQTNPETLEEFKEFIRVQGKYKLTTEQLAKYDELVAETFTKEDKPKILEGESELVETERAQTKHTKTGEDLFVVKLVGRVPKEKFRELSGKAKQLGGYYSSYSKGGAIAGFQFKTNEQADSFEMLLNGEDVNKSDFVQAKAEVKQAKNADKLIDMAYKLETKAEEELNKPRLTNTGKRASQAAHATQQAYKQIAISKTVRNIANGLQNGDLVHLGKISQVTQLENLLSIQRQAITPDLMVGDYDGYSMNYQLKDGVTLDDYIRNVKYPNIVVDSRKAEDIADSLKGKKGYARLSAELRKLPYDNTRKNRELKILSAEQAKKIIKANKDGVVDTYLGFIPDNLAQVNRLKRMGIETEEQLRAAIRELDSLSVEKQKEDPVKKLERDLIGKKIDGFFPTPQNIVEQMIDYADIQAGHEVLEPSAGKGNIAQELVNAAPNAQIEVVEYNSSLRAILEAKGFNVVGQDFLETTKNYDRIVMNPPFENFQDIDHVRHAYSILKPEGKIVAIMGAGVKNSRSKAKEFRAWLDEIGGSIEDLPEGSFKTSERPTGVNTVLVTINKGDNNTLLYRKEDDNYKPSKNTEPKIFHAPGHNFIGTFKSMGIPERREFVYIESRKLTIPNKPQRIEPIMSKLIQIMGRRIYFGKIKGKSTEGFYRPETGEIRTRKKNDVEVLAHEMAHYLDFYSNVTLPNFKALYQNPKYSGEVKSLSYTDADNKIQEIEGFAEFVRLWLTNSQEALSRAPQFYEAFTNALAKDRKLLNRMRGMQDMMHRFYFQGADKLGQALIGANPSFKQRINEWKYRRDSIIRQEVIDKYHAARKIEQELTGKIGNVKDSAWKQFRIANGGSEGIADYILNYGTLNFDSKGDLIPNGDSLHKILEPVKGIKLTENHKGEQKIDLLLRYFAGRRALELHKQGRENLIPKETAIEWAKLGGTYKIFESIHKNYQDFNKRMMDFYQDAGLVSKDARKAMESMNKDYVPFNRIRDQLAGGKAQGAGGFKRLRGGTANLNDILVNIQDGVVSNVREALQNKAKQRLYQYITGHKDGAIFATKLAPDSKKVQVHLEEMQGKIASVLEKNGIEIEGEIDLTDPELLSFWQHGIKPKLNESGNLVDTVIIDGKPKYFEVQDPMLQEMLLSMNPESYGWFMNTMFGAKNLFTRSITLGIEFTGANLVRDTLGASVISKNNFKPFIDSFRGMYSFLTKDKYYQDFMRTGGGYSSRLEAMTKEGTARRRVSVDEFGVMTPLERLFSTYDNLMSAFEYGTRIGEFRLAKKNMKSDMDAGFEGREISTDFSVMGANRFLTGYIRTVPFLNAMIQSQDRVFRGALVSKRYDGNPVPIAMKAFLGLTVSTLMLYMLNKDDEDYQAIPEYIRRTNWLFKIGGYEISDFKGFIDGKHVVTANGSRFVKIPRPYDVGFIYATMPELYFKYLEDEKGKEFADGMLWTLGQMYGIDGTPAVASGYLDLLTNKKWTGSPVVPQQLKNVSAPEQYTSYTSETFVRMGELTGMSPVKAEHVFKSYTGYLGGYLLALTDNMLWNEDKFGERPERELSQNVFLKRFLTPEVRPSTSYMEKFFDLKEKSDEIVATFKQQTDARRAITGKLKEKGHFKNDKFFGLSAEEKKTLFALNDSMNDLIKLIYGKDGIKTAELSVKFDKKLSAKQKREKMDKLWESRNELFYKYYNSANKALTEAKERSKKFKQGER